MLILLTEHRKFERGATSSFYSHCKLLHACHIFVLGSMISPDAGQIFALGKVKYLTHVQAKSNSMLFHFNLPQSIFIMVTCYKHVATSKRRRKER